MSTALAPPTARGVTPAHDLGTSALLQALAFHEPSPEALRSLDEDTWNDLLPWCDRRQISLLLAQQCPEALPESVLKKIARRRAEFELRHQRIQGQLAQVADVLNAEGIPFAVLKGFTHSPSLTPDPALRAQGDIDLWCPPADAVRAYDALRREGYQAGRSDSARHLPPLALCSYGEWSGNLADLPIHVELHHSLWSTETEHIRVPHTEAMWERRIPRSFGDRTYDVLALPDLVGFAALHIFLHLSHGDLPLQRVWEIAHFLEYGSVGDEFWQQRDAWHSRELRRIETVVFQIAADWFRCRLPARVQADVEALPNATRCWLDDFSLSPVTSHLDGNKHHVWLRFAVASGANERSRLAANALFGFAKGEPVPISKTAGAGLRWAARCVGFEHGFGPFLLASALFDVGEFIFVLLYSLYLIDAGYRENVIGFIAAGMTAGTLIGSPLAAMVESRWGLRALLCVASLGGGIAALLRIAVWGVPALVATSVLNGAFFAFWAVAFPPVIAGVTSRRNRSLAFGLVTAMGMSIGIFVGPLGVRLPDWIGATFSVAPVTSKKLAIVLGAAIVFLAAIPASRLKVHRPKAETRTYPRGKFIYLFVAALFLWTLATASFNPFAIPYLALKLHLPTHQIGTVFSSGQALQVIAMLFGPLWIRRIGEQSYLVITAAGAACMLLLLAWSGPALALPAYLAYLTLQYMNEPSLFALLMNRVQEQQRSGASSLMFIAMSLAGCLAAVAAGPVIKNMGYSTCLMVAALIGCIAAVLFSRLPDFASRLQNHNN